MAYVYEYHVFSMPRLLPTVLGSAASLTSYFYRVTSIVSLLTVYLRMHFNELFRSQFYETQISHQTELNVRLNEIANVNDSLCSATLLVKTRRR